MPIFAAEYEGVLAESFTKGAGWDHTHRTCTGNAVVGIHASPILSIHYLVLKQKDEKMKNVLVILAGSLLATTAKAQMPSPVDSLKISKDVSLDEVVITATKVGKETP